MYSQNQTYIQLLCCIIAVVRCLYPQSFFHDRRSVPYLLGMDLHQLECRITQAT